MRGASTAPGPNMSATRWPGVTRRGPAGAELGRDDDETRAGLGSAEVVGAVWVVGFTFCRSAGREDVSSPGGEGGRSTMAADLGPSGVSLRRGADAGRGVGARRRSPGRASEGVPTRVPTRVPTAADRGRRAVTNPSANELATLAGRREGVGALDGGQPAGANEGVAAQEGVRAREGGAEGAREGPSSPTASAPRSFSSASGSWSGSRARSRAFSSRSSSSSRHSRG